MTDNEPELIGLDFVADSLQPTKLVVWGDLALRYLGVPVAIDDYMLGVCDDEIELAAQKLADAGFIRQNWSLGFPVDPALHPNSNEYIQATTRASYANIDAKSFRFHYLSKSKYVQLVILLPTSYIRLDVPQPPFYVDGNLHYPNAVMLLQSIIKVYLEEIECTPKGFWRGMLNTWAVSYLYWELSLRDDILDNCGDERVKEYFNREIKCSPGKSRVREKWGKPKPLNTNDLIKDFQIREG